MRATDIIAKLVFFAILIGALVFLIVPAVLVVALSFSNDRMIAFPPTSWGLNNYVTLLEQTKWVEAGGLSMLIAASVAVLSVVIVVPANFALRRTRLSRIRGLPFLAILPLLVPQSAFAIGMYVVMAQLGLLGHPAALVSAQLAVCFPFVFVLVQSQFTRLPPELDLVAMTLGASRIRAWIGIVGRLLLPTIAAGALFAFLTSFDEAVFSNFLAGPNLQTLPKLIFDSVRLGVDPVITAIATILMVFTAAVMALAGFLRSRGT